MDIRVGEWLVVNDASWLSSEPTYICFEVLKVTAKTVTHPNKWGSARSSRRNLSSGELWCGPEAEAKALVERLNSSVGLAKDERRRSLERHHERARKMVAALSPGAGGGEK